MNKIGKIVQFCVVPRITQLTTRHGTGSRTFLIKTCSIMFFLGLVCVGVCRALSAIFSHLFKLESCQSSKLKRSCLPFYPEIFFTLIVGIDRVNCSSNLFFYFFIYTVFAYVCGQSCQLSIFISLKSSLVNLKVHKILFTFLSKFSSVELSSAGF